MAASVREALEAALNDDENDESKASGDIGSDTSNSGVPAEGENKAGDDLPGAGDKKDEGQEGGPDPGGDTGSESTKEAEAARDGAEQDPGKDEWAGSKLNPPEDWPSKDREAFESLPAESKEFLLRRSKEIQADYTRKTQEAAELKKQYEPLNQVVAEFRPFAQQQGMTEHQLVNAWANAQKMLINGQGRDLLMYLADQYNVNLGEQPEGEQNSQISELKQHIAKLENQLGQTVQTVQSSHSAAMEERLNEFANQKDDKGELLHPHFDDVMEDMVYLAKVEKQAGKTPNVNDLYDRAVWMNPTIREKKLASQREAEAEKARQDAERKKREEKERAEKANLASANASGDGSAPAPTQDGSNLRSLIEHEFKEQKGRI